MFRCFWSLSWHTVFTSWSLLSLVVYPEKPPLAVCGESSSACEGMSMQKNVTVVLAPLGLQVGCLDFRDDLWKLRENIGPWFSLCGFSSITIWKKQIMQKQGVDRSGHGLWGRQEVFTSPSITEYQLVWERCGWTHLHKHRALFNSSGFIFGTESLSALSHKLLTILHKRLSVFESSPFT